MNSGPASTADPTTTAARAADGFPATVEQAKIWLACRREPDSARYTIPVDLEFDGSVDVEALRLAVADLVAAHPQLRSRFEVVDDQLTRVVEANATVPFADLRLPGAYDRAEALRTAARLAERPLDTATAPLLRADLLHHDDAALLMVTVHHIVADAHSMYLLVDRLLAAYRRRLAGEEPQPAPAAATAETTAATAAVSGPADPYWERLLAGGPQALAPLPDLVRATDTAGPGGWAERALGPERFAALREFAARERVSPAMVLLSAWSLLLLAWSAEDDGVLGMPFAGRDLPGSEQEIGLFTRVLPIRVGFDRDAGFRDFLGSVRNQVLDSMEELAVTAESGRDIRLPADLAFQSVFLYQPGTTEQWRLPGAEVRVVRHEAAGAKFDLSLAAVELDGGLVLSVDYDAALYHPATGELMAAQLDALLAGLTDDPERSCAALLAALGPQAVTSGAAPAAPEARHRAATVAELVLEQAERFPDAVAIRHGAAAVRYRELVQRASRCAHRLRAEGVRTDDTVAVLLPPGADTLVTLLAISLAGAAYLPLDPAYPEAQLRLILADARPRLLVTAAAADDAAAGRLADDAVATLGVDLLLAESRWFPVRPPRTGANPDTAFNVLYTSGSTGRPKGVVLPHAGVLRLMHRPDFVPIDRTDVVSHLSPLNFDGATYEIWAALTHGACLVVLDRELVLSPVELRDAVRRYGVTTLLVTTPLLNRLIEDAPDLLQSLRRVYFGGELISVPHIERALRWGRPGTLLHSYGPTENSFTSSWFPIRELPPGARTLPIGTPVPDTRLHVVFEGSTVPVPPYVPGELLLGGAGVARGYLGDPRRTAERFVPDPFTEDSATGGRLYRTGDRVRWAADGQLEFIGRTDNQVKIRSQRVELGEVESALRAHPAVRAAFVTSRRNGRGEKEIVGYLVPAEPGSLPGIREHLRRTLPQFAVPTHLVTVDELPLTANGKIDRRRLPEPGPGAESGAGTAAEDQVRPRPQPTTSPTTSPTTPSDGVRAAWREVLGHTAFADDDNFFDVGGHSLLLFRLQSVLRRLTGDTPGMGQLLRHTTVRAQARLLGGEPAGRADQSSPATGPAGYGHRPTAADEPIAVIGMAGRFAGAPDLDAYWRNLTQGADCFSNGPGQVVTDLPDGTSRVARWGLLADGGDFDAELLGFTAQDVADGDPQQGVLHEVLWAAVEDASLRLSDISRRTSLYAGCSRVLGTPEDARVDDVVNADPTFVASRFAYLHDLWGEALMLDTACSTSLYAVHLACRALQAGTSDYALAAGVSLDASSDGSYRYRPGFLYARDGVCRPFDRRATGTVGGFGAGAVLLRRLSDAVRDGDPVYAVIPGSAVNNDGRARVGYSAPGVEGQARVVREALAAAGVTGADVGYVEAHGTGTRLGDAIEATALGEALGPDGPAVALGSVKASIGHCNTAAGVAGLIKAVLAVHHGYLPSTPNVGEPIEELPDRISLLTDGRPWLPDRPRTAGVSSFGVGGTNAHVIVQQYQGV